MNPTKMAEKQAKLAKTALENPGHRFTNLYSLIQKAKANRLEPYQYLRHVFTESPKADTVEAIEALLPANIDVDLIYR